MKCKHKKVLAIYNEKQHNKDRNHRIDNISHYRCAKCGEKKKEVFGMQVIYATREKREE